MINDKFNSRMNSMHFEQNKRFIHFIDSKTCIAGVWGLHFPVTVFLFSLSLPSSPSPFPPLRSLTVDLQHVSKCRGVWSNTPRYFTNTCFRRRCPKRAVFRPFRQPTLGRETNRPRNETPVVDLIYTPAGVSAFIIYASTDRELLNRSVKNIRRLFETKGTY